jgi:hypothetical protein
MKLHVYTSLLQSVCELFRLDPGVVSRCLEGGCGWLRRHPGLTSNGQVQNINLLHYPLAPLGYDACCKRAQLDGLTMNRYPSLGQ